MVQSEELAKPLGLWDAAASRGPFIDFLESDDVRPLRAIQEEWLRRFAPLWDASLEALREVVESDDV